MEKNMNTIVRVFVLGWISLVGAIPLHGGRSVPEDGNFIARGTNELATALLQGFVQKEDNMVYSPFGYSAILAIFSEGARGTSREEIATALHFPKDLESVRQSYRSVLERFVGKKYSNSPEFKNWFYIYKNYTVEEELQNILRKYYLTEVKYVNRPEDYIKNPKKVPIQDVVDPDKHIAMEMSKIVEDQTREMLGEMDVVKNKENVAKQTETVNGVNVKDDTMTKTEELPNDIKENTNEAEKMNMEPTENKMEEANAASMSTLEKEMIDEITKTEMSTTQEMNAASQKVLTKAEEMSVTPEKASTMQEMTSEKDMSIAQEMTPESASKAQEMTSESASKAQEMASENVTETQEMTSENMSQTQETASEDMSKAQETSTSKAEEMGMAPVKTNAEMGGTPVDHFSGMTDSSIKIRGQESKSQMIIFNGLYYKGEWDTPFVKMPADDSRAFYKSENEKIFVSTIHSQGVFNTGKIQNLDCDAIELPYKGGRYSLLVLVPNSRSGLTKLISDLSGYSFGSIYEQLSEKLVDVCLPSFEINTISKPISSFNKLGLTKVSSIFDPEKADLSGISGKNSGLYVEELVQMVTFKVDADYSKANFLTASIISSRSNVPKFQINHPFLFYLRDNIEDIVIVNGKVIDPTPRSTFYFT